MPVRLTPAPDAAIPTKRVSMDQWDVEGPLAEHIEILQFLRSDTLEAARKHRRIITENGRSREELHLDAYLRSLFDVQITGWRLLDPEGKPIPYTPEHVAALPWDVKEWLHVQILACGGSLSTRDLVIQGDSGPPADFKSADDQLGTRPVAKVRHPR